jgi:hypothetical protein
MADNDHIFKNMYNEITNADENDIKPILEKIKNVINYLSHRYYFEKENYTYEDEKYNIIDENGKCMFNQKSNLYILIRMMSLESLVFMMISI